MLRGKKILALIPARGQSKGIPKKALRQLQGKSLLAWTIAAAQQSRYIDRLVLSTEDEGIIEEAQRLGCDVPFVRPQHLAADNTPGILPVLHAIEHVSGYDFIVLLQLTSPLRTTADIDGCIEYCFEKHAPLCKSICKVTEFPAWMVLTDNTSKLTPLLKTSQETPSLQRQSLSTVYRLNGAVYCAEIPWLLQHKSFEHADAIGYEMPVSRSVDIDVELDLVFAEALLSHEKASTKSTSAILGN